jgi:hypothetical protein
MLNASLFKPARSIAFTQRQIAKILALGVKTVERDKTWLTAGEHKLIELRVTLPDQANDLAIEHGGFRPAFDRQSETQRLERFDWLPFREKSLHSPASIYAIFWSGIGWNWGSTGSIRIPESEPAIAFVDKHNFANLRPDYP